MGGGVKGEEGEAARERGGGLEGASGRAGVPGLRPSPPSPSLYLSLSFYMLPSFFLIIGYLYIQKQEALNLSQGHKLSCKDMIDIS